MHQFRTSWTVDPVTGVYTASVPSPTGIPADPALTSHGTHQARELASHLMTLDPPVDAVYSSPYYRCLQTIAPFVEEKRRAAALPDGDTVSPAALVIRPEPGIGEWFGAAPFAHPKPAPAHVLKPMFPAYDEDYSPIWTPSEKGETVTELYARVAAAARAIIARSDAEGHRAVVLCSHAASVIALGRVLTGCVPSDPSNEDIKAFTCGLSVYRRQGPQQQQQLISDTRQGETVPGIGLGREGEAWTCERNSDCSFLSGGEERGW